MGKKNWKFKLGLFFVVFSCLLFLFLPLIPFLHLENKVKITISTIIFIIAEVMFWSGGILLGKELFRKYKSYLNPKNWFKKKTENQ